MAVLERMPGRRQDAAWKVANSVQGDDPTLLLASALAHLWLDAGTSEQACALDSQSSLSKLLNVEPSTHMARVDERLLGA